MSIRSAGPSLAAALLLVACPSPDIGPASVVDLEGPDSPTNETSATFTFGCDQEKCSFTCEVAGTEGGEVAPPSPCESEVRYDNLPDDDYLFTVTPVNALEEVGDPETWAWRVETDAPVVLSLEGPASVTNETGAAFSFDCSKGDCTYACTVTGEDHGVVEPEGPCTSGFAVADLEDDAYTFSVVATDPAGNTGDPATHTWAVDTVRPEVTDLQGPAEPTNDPTATFTFDCSKDPCTLDCALTTSEGDLVEAAEDCSSPYTTEAVEATDTYTFTVHARDPAGNVSDAAEHDWVVDLEEPVVSLTEDPGPVTNQTSASFAFDCSKPECSFDCTLTDTQGHVLEQDPLCDGTFEVQALDEGAYTLELVATDAVGNVGPPTTFQWVVDVTPPVVEITSGPSAYTNQGDATFHFGCTNKPDEACTFDCTVTDDGGEVVAEAQGCESGFQVTVPEEHGEGYTFLVEAVDHAGNPGTDSRAWELDLEAPEAVITEKPADPSNEDPPTFEFTCDKAIDDAERACTFACEVTTQAGGDTVAGPEDCHDGSFSPTLSAPGHYVFTVTPTDDAGNEGGPVTHEWELDTADPTVSLTEVPGDSDTRAEFEFECSKFDEPIPCTFECEVTGGLDLGPEACDDGEYAFDLPAAESYTFTVTATDAAGNTATASHTWAADPDFTPAEVTIVGGPAQDSTSTASEVTFTFECDKASCDFRCRLEGDIFGQIEGWTRCDSGEKTYSNLPPDELTFEVQALHDHGDSDEESRTWAADVASPRVVDLEGPPQHTRASTADLSYGCTRGACTYRCMLIGHESGIHQEIESCEPGGVPYTDLPDDTYTFSIKATDLQGREGVWRTHTWTVAQAVPHVEIQSGPADPTPSESATLAFTCDEEPCDVTCTLEAHGGDQVLVDAGCTSPMVYDDLEPGLYTFTAVPSIEEEEGPPAERVWRVYDPDEIVEVCAEGCAHASIAQAIDTTFSATILVTDSSTYEEIVDMNSLGVHLLAAAGESPVIEVRQPNADVVQVRFADAVVEGFTVRSLGPRSNFVGAVRVHRNGDRTVLRRNHLETWTYNRPNKAVWIRGAHSGDPSDVLLQDNTADLASYVMSFAAASWAVQVHGTGHIVRGNHIVHDRAGTSGQLHGLDVDGDARVEGNVIAGRNGSGMILAGADHLVLDNVISTATQAALQLDGVEGSLIDGNYATHEGVQSAIRATGPVTDTDLSRNTIGLFTTSQVSTPTGMDLGPIGTSTILENRFVSPARAYGIWFGGPSEGDNLIERNHFDLAEGWHHIGVDAAGLDATDLLFAPLPEDEELHFGNWIEVGGVLMHQAEEDGLILATRMEENLTSVIRSALASDPSGLAWTDFLGYQNSPQTRTVSYQVGGLEAGQVYEVWADQEKLWELEADAGGWSPWFEVTGSGSVDLTLEAVE